MQSTDPKSRARQARFLVERLEIRELMASAAVSFTDSPVQLVSDKVGSVVVSFGEDSNLFSSGDYATETVTVTAGGGTAVAGVDYQPVQQSVTLTPDNPTAQVSIPILPGSASLGTRTLPVTISPSPGDPQGSTEYIAIQHGTDNTLPKAVSAKTETRGSQIVAFSIQFSKAMAIGPVQNIANYAIPDPSSLKVTHTGSAGPIGTIALKSAIYDPATKTVVLIPSGIVKLAPIQIGKVKLTARFYTIMDPNSFSGLVAEATASSLYTLPPHPSGISSLTDLAGNPITDGNLGAGPNGEPGTLFAQGRITKIDAVTAHILRSGSVTSPTPTPAIKHTTTPTTQHSPKPVSHHG